MKYLFFVLIYCITFKCLAGNWHEVRGKFNSHKVSTGHLEKLITEYSKLNPKLGLLAIDAYVFQYKSIGKNTIFINALCDVPNEEKLGNEIIVVFDGGACYFQTTYHLKSNKLINFRVNGEA